MQHEQGYHQVEKRCSGDYRRDVGWEPESSGRIKQHTFYFGTNQTTAQVRLVVEQAGRVNRQREAIKAIVTGKLARLAGPVVVCEGQEALDAFAAWHRDNYKTPDGKPTYHAYIAGERIKAIKRLAPNLSLQAFGLDEIERMVATWKNRPMSSRGKPYIGPRASGLLLATHPFISSVFSFF